MDIELLRNPLVLYGGGVCLGLQLLAALRYWWFLKRFRWKVRRLASGGPAALVADTRASGWFAWLRGRWRARDGRPAPPDRAAALGELDWHLGSSFWLSALQRLGYAAPLVGLLLTALGFFGFNPTSGTDGTDLGAVLRATLPLMLGVAVGAVLALLNQFLLLIVQPAADRARAAARDWLDDLLVAAGADNPLGPVADALRAELGEIGQAAGRFSAAADESKAAAARLAQAAAALGDQADLTAQLTRALTSTGETLGQLAAHTGSAATELEATSRAHAEWGAAGARAAADLAATATDLRGQVGDLRGAVNTHNEVAVALRASVETGLGPAQAAFAAALSECRAATTGLADGVGTLTGTTTAAVARFGETVGTLAAAVDDRLVPFTRSLAPVQGVLDRIGDVGAPLAAAAEAMTAAAGRHHDAAAHLVPAYDRMTEALAATTGVAEQLRAVQAAIGPAVEALGRSVGTVAEAGRQVGALSAGGLEPMAARFAQIDRAATALAGVVESVRPLTGAGELVGEIRQLARAFDQMQRATDQQREIAELLRDLAEAARARPRGSFLSRLFGPS